jgi:fucose permease
MAGIEGAVEVEQAPQDERSWLYNHIGRLAGIVLGLFVIAVITLLAIAGYEPAISLLVVIVSGFLIISVGGKMRGGR